MDAGWDDELLRVELAALMDDGFNIGLTGFTDDEVNEPDFSPGMEEDQGKLDELDPKMVICPKCQHEFDAREHEA